MANEYILRNGVKVLGNLETSTLRITSGATAGYFLSTDGSGNATWTTVSASGNGVTASGTANYISKFTNTNVLGNSSIYDNGTFVGIDSSSQYLSEKLTVNGDISMTSSAFLRFGGLARFGSYPGNSSYYTNIWSSGSGEGIIFLNYNGTSKLMTLTDGGNLGIGTASPGVKLDIYDGALNVRNLSGTPFIAQTDLDGTASIAIFRSNDAAFVSGQELRMDYQQSLTTFARMSAYLHSGNTFGLKFYGSDGSGLNVTPLLTLRGDKLNGINTSTPAANLHVQGVSGNNPFRVDTAGATTSIFVNDSGNVGINTTTPTTPFNVNYQTSTTNYSTVILADGPSTNGVVGGHVAYFRRNLDGAGATASVVTIEHTNRNGGAAGASTLRVISGYGGKISQLQALSSGMFSMGATYSSGSSLLTLNRDTSTLVDAGNSDRYSLRILDSEPNLGANANRYGVSIVMSGTYTPQTVGNQRLYGIYSDVSSVTSDTSDVSVISGVFMGGNVGIGTNAPSYRLQVSGTVSTTAFRMTNGASNGYYLQSDASGNATWASLVVSGNGVTASGTTNTIAKFTNTNVLGDSLITDNGSTVTIAGNLTVTGTSTTVNTVNLTVQDPIILLSSTQSGSPVLDSGFMVRRGSSATQSFFWDESADEFVFASTNDGDNVIGNISITSYSPVKSGDYVIIGSGTTSGSYGLKINDNNSNRMLWVRNDGFIQTPNRTMIEYWDSVGSGVGGQLLLGRYLDTTGTYGADAINIGNRYTNQNNNYGLRSVSIGFLASSTHDRGISIGSGALSYNDDAITIGQSNINSGIRSISIGAGGSASSSSTDSIQIGTNNITTKTLTTSLGYNINMTGNAYDIGIGSYVNVSGAGGANAAFGNYVAATGTIWSYVFGAGINNSNKLTNPNSSAMGFGLNSTVPTLWVTAGDGTNGSYGNVGVGLDSTAISAKTHIKGADSTASNYALKVDNSASSALLNINNSGGVGIGALNSTTASQVYVASSKDNIFYVEGNGSLKFVMGSSGNLSFGGAGLGYDNNRFNFYNGRMGIIGDSSGAMNVNGSSYFSNNVINNGEYSMSVNASMATNISGYAIRAYVSGGDNSIGVYARAISGSNQTAIKGQIDYDLVGTQYGVYGDVISAYSTNNYGLYGNATGGTNSANNYGVYGAAFDNSNYINRTNYGGYFFANSSNTGVTGSRAIAGYFRTSGIGTNYGIIVENGISGFGTISPTASALVEMSSTTKGFLPPRMTTTQREAISSPATGLMIYNTTTNYYNLYTGSTWSAMAVASDLNNIKLASVGITIDGQGGTITTGNKGYIVVPYSGTITGWQIFGDVSGSIVVDVWKTDYTNYPPTVSNTIAGSEKPTLTSQTKNQDLNLTTWTTTVTAGDIIAFNVDSATTVSRVNLSILITRT